MDMISNICNTVKPDLSSLSNEDFYSYLEKDIIK